MLATVGRVLRDPFRNTETVAHIGGNEFVLLWPDTAPRGAEGRSLQTGTAITHTSYDHRLTDDRQHGHGDIHASTGQLLSIESGRPEQPNSYRLTL